MANINLSISGESNTASANGEVTDPEILDKINEVLQYMSAKSFQSTDGEAAA